MKSPFNPSFFSVSLFFFVALIVVLMFPVLSWGVERAESEHLTRKWRGGEIQNVSRGVFLVADPRIVDPNFTKTVIFITHHDENGSTGLIINRATSSLLSELLPDVKQYISPNTQLFSGGPVMKETLTLLFRSESPSKPLSPIFEDVYGSQEARVLANLLMRSGTKGVFRVYSGYAGWGPSQLQMEVTRGDWRLVTADAEIIFNRASGMIWSEMFSRSQQQVVKWENPVRVPSFSHSMAINRKYATVIFQKLMRKNR